MKKLLTVLIFLLVATPAIAMEEWERFCTNMTEFAESAMQKRQEGVSPTKLLKVIDNINTNRTEKKLNETES